MSVPEQLARILASREFRDSPRMCRFLRFVVERTLAGEGSSLKEYLIGVEVFDRKDTYDPRVDPIVRVEARRLRAKLKAYYHEDGNSDPIVIELPTGKYTPTFRNFGTRRESTEPMAKQNHSHPGRTIAVLPFANLTADTESEYFTDGLTEELTHMLTKVPGLQVVSWNSTAQLRGRNADAQAVAQELQADVFVRGSVRTARGRVRVTTQLLEAPRGIVLWSESYDRNLEDIFAVQEEIARAIAEAMQLRLVDHRRSDPGMNVYDLYLRGRYYWNTRTPEGLRRSIECFQEAIAIDPNYALAHAGVADGWIILVDHGVLPAEDLKRAEEAAERAIQLDPSLAEPYSTLALIRTVQWRWQEAKDLYDRSLALNPNYSTAYHWLGIDLLAVQGRFEEAQTYLDTAYRLDPLSPIVAESRGLLTTWWGKHSESLAIFDDLCRRHGPSARVQSSLGRVYGQMGDYARAIELLEAAHRKDPETASRLGALGQTYAWAGRPVDARGCLDRLHALATHQHVSGTCFALIHASLGEEHEAMNWLELAARRYDSPILVIGIHPAYDCLRGNARFHSLLQRMNLIDAETRAQSYRKAAR